MKKSNMYMLVCAEAKDEKGNFIPAEKLVWHQVLNEYTHNTYLRCIYDNYDEANVDRIKIQKMDNERYYKVI